MGLEVKKAKMEEQGVDSIVERLSSLPDLHLPHSLASRSEPVTQDEKRLHLVSLLRRDAAVFLERYGPHLNSGELQQFEVLEGDYEVGWHLKSLRSAINPTVAEQRSQAATVKNRRMAYMNRLIQDGQYFSEDAMRMRSPLLHHEYVGQFQDPASRGVAARPGERFSDLLIRQAEEAWFQRRLREERVEAGIPVADDVEYDENEDDEEAFQEELDTDEEEEIGHNTVEGAQLGPSNGASNHEREGDVNTETSGEEGSSPGPMVLSDVQLMIKIEDFTRVMQEKFLAGGDSEHVDYVRIDSDMALDDDWMPEISRDAEEKYFEQD